VGLKGQCIQLQRTVDDMIGEKRVSDNRIFMLESQLEEYKANLKDVGLKGQIQLQRIVDDVFTSKEIAMREIADIELSLNNCTTELESTQRVIDDITGEKKVSDDHILILESQLKEDKAKLNEMADVTGQCIDLQRIVDDMIGEKKVSDDHILMLENQKKNDERYLKRLTNQNAILENRIKVLHTRLRDLKSQRYLYIYVNMNFYIDICTYMSIYICV
jgi:chromosome segregation ATPase